MFNITSERAGVKSLMYQWQNLPLCCSQMNKRRGRANGRTNSYKAEFFPIDRLPFMMKGSRWSFMMKGFKMIFPW